MFALRDAGTGVADADYTLAAAAKQGEFDTSALGGKFHGVVDQIGDGLEKQIAVAVHHRLIGGVNPKDNTFVLSDWIVEITHLAQQRGQSDLTKSFEPAAMLDLANAQQRSDDGQSLVETGDRLIGDRPKLRQRCSVLAPALKADPHAGERRAQVVGDVVADTGNFLNESFNFAQHPVDADGKLIERVITAAGRQALAQ